MNIWYHADDYAISVQQAERILSCRYDGVLNSLSIFPQSTVLEACVDMLRPYLPQLSVSVHLNLAEGKSCAAPESVPLLVDERGFLSLDFGTVLKKSLGKDKAAFQQQVKIELAAQIDRISALFPEKTPLRLDGHQHIHIIPLVFSTLLEIIAEKQLSVDYLRIPTEPFLCYLRHPSVLFACPPINLVKVAVLDLFYRIDRKAFQRSGIKTAVFFGVALSGAINENRMETLLPSLIKTAQRRHMDLEVLMHPGGVDTRSECPDPEKKGFCEFYLSPCRKTENAVFHSLKDRVGRIKEDALSCESLS